MGIRLLPAARLLALSTAAIAGAALAADLPRKAPPVPVLVMPWDGLYAGAQVGYSWARSSGVLTDLVGTNPIPWSVAPQGVIGGVHAGYDRQFGNFVLGVVADVEAVDHRRETTLPGGGFRFGGAAPNVRFVSELNWLASLRGRVGMPFGKTLVYATGGLAIGDVVTGYFPAGFPIPFLGTVTDVRPGWTAGLGVEHAFARDWTARLEYRYTELQSARNLVLANAAADDNRFNQQAIRLGVSWRPGANTVTTASGYFAPRPVRTTMETGRWSGFYLGAHVGGVWNKTTGNLFGFPEQTFGAFAPPATASLNSSGVLGGLQAGYNHRLGDLVLGLEHDFSFANLPRSAVVTGSVAGVPYTVTEGAKLEWLASMRGRVGYAPNENWLIYGTGGIGYGWADAWSSTVFPAQAYFGHRNELRVGWIAGAGAQYALNDRWSVRAEYLHYDLGGMQVMALPVLANPPFQTRADLSWSGDIVRVGVDYKIGLPAPAAVVSVMPTKAPAKGIASISDLQTTFGGRYWYSTGRSQKTVFGLDAASNTVVSRLTYDDLTAHSAEAFFRTDHRSGLYVKGYAGIGAMPGGRQNDEDFPPFAVPYSNTESSNRNSHINYVSADVGFDVFRTEKYRLGVLAGYHYDREKMNQYGCRQVAGGGFCTVPGPASAAVLNITDDNHWHSIRLGVNGSVQLVDRLTFTAEAAWLPYTRLAATDTHWLRQSTVPFAGLALFGPLPEDGVGHTGYQVEALLDYKVTDAFSVGLGGRYWRMATRGNMHAENPTIAIGSSGAPQRLDYTLERYGGFLQGSYKF